MVACVLSIRSCLWSIVVVWVGFCCDRLPSLMRAPAGNSYNTVDIYNSGTGAWSTAQLSVARYFLVATSVGSVALFAGGYDGSELLCWKGEGGS
jgi:hypothetical protein